MPNRREFLCLPLLLSSVSSNSEGSVLLLGDSLTAQCWQMLNAPKVDVRRGRLLVQAERHGQWAGAPIRLTGMGAADGDHVISAVTAGTIEIPYDGPLPRIVGTSTVLLKSSFASAGYWLWLNGMAGGELTLADCAGVVGATSADILGKSQLALKNKPDIVVDLSYFNDLGRLPKEVMLKNRILLAEKSIAAGARHVHVSALPLQRNGPKTNSENLATLKWINAGLKEASDGKRVLYADAWSRCVGVDGVSRDAAVASDNIHLSQVGAYAIAAAIWRELARGKTCATSFKDARQIRLVGSRHRLKLDVPKGPWISVMLPVAVADTSRLVSLYARVVIRTEEGTRHVYAGTPARASTPVSEFGAGALKTVFASPVFQVPSNAQDVNIELVAEGDADVRLSDPWMRTAD